MDFAAHIRRLTSRLASTVTRGIITRVNDALSTQNVQVELRFHDMADDVELFQPFGVSFHPPVDSEVLVLAVGSSQDNLVALTATSRADRPTSIQEGEGGLYTPSGWKVFLDANDNVFLATKTATQRFVRGDDQRDALIEYANAVTEAVGKITYTGNGSVDPSTATAALAEASLQLLSDLNGSLSQKIKGE